MIKLGSCEEAAHLIHSLSLSLSLLCDQGMKATAAGDFADLFAKGGGGGGIDDDDGRPGSADSRATLRTPEVSLTGGQSDRRPTLEV